jgi:hypothetical protein
MAPSCVAGVADVVSVAASADSTTVVQSHMANMAQHGPARTAVAPRRLASLRLFGGGLLQVIHGVLKRLAWLKVTK